MLSKIVLLRAAELAHEHGKHGLIILRRQDIRHIRERYVYGQDVRTVPMGFESDIDVLFVDPAALPAAYAKTPWRVLDVDAIWVALAPIYRQGPT